MYNTNKIKYMLQGLAYIAIHGQNKNISLKDIARAQNISMRYLEQAFSDLKKNGLVTSEKGPKGGYTLNFSMDTTVAAILEAVMPYERASEAKGNRIVESLNNVLWTSFDEGIIASLRSVTFEDIVTEYEKLNQDDNYMYYI